MSRLNVIKHDPNIQHGANTVASKPVEIRPVVCSNGLVLNEIVSLFCSNLC